jgi:DNA-binding NtrC family response regulator
VGDLHRLRILVVDDEELMRKLMTNMLVKAGMEVLAAESGEEALRMLQENGCDVVVSDVRMTGMSGLDLLKQVKAQHPNIAFVTMTGYTDLCGIKEALLQGADEYITKPFKNHEIELVIERAYWRSQSNCKQTESA